MTTSLRIRRAAGVCAILAALAVTGCSRYYQVTDTVYGDVYYTDSLDNQSPEPGQRLRFVDAQTGAVVRLSDYEIQRTSRRNFDQRTHQAPVASADELD